ncbi:hypothetical protein GF336_00770 [Candidatus Woesearchaeota archaeon]|nr:hypothetical protein [Candidatus Woesearchaeota archaeon]
MKKTLTFFTILILAASLVSATETNPGHSADEIGGTDIADRTFQDADYSFQDNVGIGTDSPTRLLTLSGDGPDGLRIENSGGDPKARILVDSSDRGLLTLYNSTGSEIVNLRTEGDSHIRGGNVGIGTSSPTSKLEVKSDQGNVFILKNSLDNNIFRVYSNEDDPINNGVVLQLSNASGDIKAVISSRAEQDTYFNAGSGSNVGIGTSSPSTPFHVLSGSGNEGIYSPSGWTVGLFQRNDDSNYHARVSILAGTSQTAGIWMGDKDNEDNGAIWTDNSDNSLNLGNGLSNAVITIDSSDNVGIGTTSPGAKLQVGDIKIGSKPSGLAGPTGGDGIHADGHLHIQSDGSNNGNGDIQLNKWSSGDVFMVLGGGSVGIGTNSPSYKLHVEGSLGAHNFYDEQSPTYYLNPGEAGTSANLRGDITAGGLSGTGTARVCALSDGTLCRNGDSGCSC